MFSKSNLLATFVAGIAMFFLGYLIWGVATVKFFEEHALTNVMKEVPYLGLIALGNIIGAFVLSSLYAKCAQGEHSLAHGFQYGAWIGAFVGISMGLIWYATANWMDASGHIVEAIINIFYYGIIGVIIALVYQKTSTPDERHSNP